MNYDDAIAVTRDIHWVGFEDRAAALHCNPYLLIDDDDVVLFDPGSIPHFPIVMRKVIDLVAPERVSWIVASHQDPDVCGNLSVMVDVISNPALRVATHSLCARLICHYGMSTPMVSVDEQDHRVTLRSGRTLRFIPTPFLHSPGAIATYDEASKTLFSSDLFGAIGDDWSLFARGDYLDAIARFHRGYMPSGAVLRACMTRLGAVEIERILPQHGSILEGAQVGEAIAMLSALPCGIDRLEG